MKIQNFWKCLLVISMISAQTFAGGRGQQGVETSLKPATEKPAEKPSLNTKLPDSETIQTIGIKAKNNSNKGKNLATAAIAVTAAGAAATCNHFSWKCKLFLAGLAASIAVRVKMNKASGTSVGTVEAVTTDVDPYNPNSPSTADQKMDYQNEPEYKEGMATIKALEKKGWKVDIAGGKVTDPKGKTFMTASLSSPAAMRAAGASDSDIKGFQDSMAKVPELAAQKSNSADGKTDILGEEDAGGGGSKPVASADSNGGLYGGLGMGSSPKIGIDRDPAQVAGMKKDFNGSPIGISQDSLFNMIDRRYELHQKNGSFLSP